MSAGNLGTTQSVIEQIERDLQSDTERNLGTLEYISDIADYVGNLSLVTQQKYAEGGQEASFNAGASYIVGGQIKGRRPEVYMIYPQGNHISVSEQTPFLQIGETKYGKPILDRIIQSDTTHETAMRCALVSMDSTMRSNVTVGPPVELLYLPDGELTDSYYRKFEENDEYLVNLRKSWDEEIRRAFNDLPPLDS